jgi:hypothetical protein
MLTPQEASLRKAGVVHEKKLSNQNVAIAGKLLVMDLSFRIHECF